MIQVKDGRATLKVQLSRRFQELIDIVAMRKGLAGTDAYLDAWRRGPPVERDGSAEQVANAVKDELEAQFDALKASALAAP